MDLFQLTRQYSITDEENVIITRIMQLRRYTYSIVEAKGKILILHSRFMEILGTCVIIIMGMILTYDVSCKCLTAIFVYKGREVKIFFSYFYDIITRN